MSEYDASTYERFSSAVRRQVQSLRIILDSLQVSVTALVITFRACLYTMTSLYIETLGFNLSSCSAD